MLKNLSSLNLKVMSLSLIAILQYDYYRLVEQSQTLPDQSFSNLENNFNLLIEKFVYCIRRTVPLSPFLCCTDQGIILQNLSNRILF